MKQWCRVKNEKGGKFIYLLVSTKPYLYSAWGEGGIIQLSAAYLLFITPKLSFRFHALRKLSSPGKTSCFQEWSIVCFSSYVVKQLEIVAKSWSTYVTMVLNIFAWTLAAKLDGTEGTIIFFHARASVGPPEGIIIKSFPFRYQITKFSFFGSGRSSHFQTQKHLF